MRPSQAIIALEAVVNTLPRSLTRNGTQLSKRDAKSVKEVYQQWVLLLLDLGYFSHEDLRVEGHRLFRDIGQHDVLDALQAFADCLQEVYNSRLGAYNRGFKALCKFISPRLYSLIKEDVKLASVGDIYAMRRLIQVFAFPSRLSLIDVDLMDQCLDDYKATEEQMQPQYAWTFVRALNKIVKRWFRHIDLTDLDFMHGPGGVAGLGRTSLENKYCNLGEDALTRYAFPDYEPPLFARYASDGTRLHPMKVEMSRVSSTIFVPKSYKTFRTISMEPPTLMFLQQGVWSRIDEYVSKYKYLHARIGFHDQTRNQELAKIGSLARSHATIDLSAASDSVSWQLVKEVFKGTRLLRYLYACRSTHTMLPDRTYMALKKFAPMGSALCFPVETIIFAAICEFVTREHNFHGDYSVFGDDIIVPTKCVPDVFYVLECLGFKPNESKSFFREDCAFRESCGGEYFNGFDVTPLRISRKYTSELTDVGFVGVSKMMNTCLSKGYRHLRAFLWKKMQDEIKRQNKKYFERYLPHFSPTAIESPSYSNFHLVHRWNIQLQRLELQASQIIVKAEPRNEEIAYYDYLIRKKARTDRQMKSYLDRLYEDYENFVPFYRPIGENQTGKLVVKLRQRWMPAPYNATDENFIRHCIQLHHGVRADSLVLA